MGERSLALLAAMVLLAGACSNGDRSGSEGAADTQNAAPAGTGTAQDAPATADSVAAEGAGHAHAGEGEGESLLLIMQKLGTHMTALTYGLMTDDSAMVANGAESIAEHAPIAPEEIERIHGVLGTDMAEFERLDEAVHTASVRLRDAAAAGRTQDVLTLLGEVQRGCVACHSQFRERLLTNPSR